MGRVAATVPAITEDLRKPRREAGCVWGVDALSWEWLSEGIAVMVHSAPGGL